MRDNSTHITIVLDRSGSMATVLMDTIGGFNTFLREQQETPGMATLTLVQFSTEYTITHNAVPLAAVPELTTSTYRPGGGTALLDAIGRAIHETGTALAAMPETDRPSRVLLVIMTDGEENSSKEFTRPQIFEMITHQREKYDWEVAFIGANQDAIQTGRSLGVAAGSSMDYLSDGDGTQSAFKKLSSSASFYRGAPAPAKGKFFDEEPAASPTPPEKSGK